MADNVIRNDIIKLDFDIGGTLKELKKINEDINELKKNNGDLTGIDQMVTSAIYDAFSNVFKQLFINKYGYGISDTIDTVEFDIEDIDKTMTISEIINKCIEDGTGFDTISLKFDTEEKVVNPVSVDVEALKACMRLIVITVTTSQFIYKDYDPATGERISLKEV